MNKEVKFLIKIVKKASKMISNKFEVKEKDERGDLVTSLDEQIEKFLIKNIKKVYPNFDIVSEEFNSDKQLSQNCFILDPIDGTINFANGQPLWGIQVACRKNGSTCASVIYLPCFKELYYADETGAYLNGKPIHVKPLPPKNSVYVVYGKRFEEREEISKFAHNFRYLGSTAVHCAWMAAGRMSVLCAGTCKIWDKEPGFYLIKQAGGVTYEEEGLYMAACSQQLLSKFKNAWKAAKK